MSMESTAPTTAGTGSSPGDREQFYAGGTDAQAQAETQPHMEQYLRLFRESASAW